MSDPRAVVALALVLGAPWAIVLVVALVRGYSITVVFRRHGRAEDYARHARDDTGDTPGP